MVGGIPSLLMRFATDCRALLLARHCLRPRFRIPRHFLARRCWPVEAGNCVLAMGGVGQPWLRRAALHFLSAPFLAARARVNRVHSLGLRPSSLHHLGADFCGTIRICLCAPYAAAKFYA